LHHGSTTTQEIILRDLLVPANKRFELAEANKKIDLVNPSCPPSSKILGNICSSTMDLYSASVAYSQMFQRLSHYRLSMECIGPNAPRSLNPIEHQGKSSALRKPTIIRIRMRSQLDLKTPILTGDEIDVTNLDEETQISLATARSTYDFKIQQAVKKVNKHLVDEEIEKIVEGNDDVDANKFVDDILNSQKDPDTRLEPRSHKESPKVKKSVDLMIIIKEEEKLAEDTLVKGFPGNICLPYDTTKRMNPQVSKVYHYYPGHQEMPPMSGRSNSNLQKPSRSPALFTVIYALQHDANRPS
ncbi:hypothetical protein Tco_1137518, partial [Tanacetum coccineum]